MHFFCIDYQNLQPTDLLLTENDPGFFGSGLKVSSVLKLDKIATIQKKIVLGELGNLTKSLMEKVNDKLKISLALN
ncbi:MAG: type II toxin-antitoxin system PemK/MazF family toxin [bacterium]